MRKASSLLKQSTREIDSFSEWRANVKKCLRKIWIYQSLVMSEIKKENLHSFEWKEPWRKILSFLILPYLKWSILLLLCTLLLYKGKHFFKRLYELFNINGKKLRVPGVGNKDKISAFRLGRIQMHGRTNSVLILK